MRRPNSRETKCLMSRYRLVGEGADGGEGGISVREYQILRKGCMLSRLVTSTRRPNLEDVSKVEIVHREKVLVVEAEGGLGWS